jgi:hypothetical protein
MRGGSTPVSGERQNGALLHPQPLRQEMRS